MRHTSYRGSKHCTLLSMLIWPPVHPLQVANKTERLREMVSETGVCGELTSLRLPLPLNPSIMLEGAQQPGG